MILNFLYVGIGGALGAISRFGINELFERTFLTSFPIPTLFINVLGCFFIGIYLGINIPVKDSFHYFFIIGFLGSFTTMSAFTHQTIIMFNANLISAVSYIMITIILSILATYFGALITR
tara:strand:+ start:6388 stop:6747 length:360 start_codon:yes stop_codon:yes gene_type:complete